MNMANGVINKQKEWKLIWENASPHTSFGQQKVAIDLTEYNELIYCITPPEGYSSAQEVITRGVRKYVYAKKGERTVFDGVYGSQTIQRGMDYPGSDDTGVYFGPANKATTVTNTLLVPFRIYGR